MWVSEGDSGRLRLVDINTGNHLKIVALNQGEWRNSFTADLAFDANRRLIFVVDQSELSLGGGRYKEGADRFFRACGANAVCRRPFSGRQYRLCLERGGIPVSAFTGYDAIQRYEDRVAVSGVRISVNGEPERRQATDRRRNY